MRLKLMAGFVLGTFVSCLSSTGFAADRGLDRESPLMVGEGAAPASDTVDYQVFGSPGQSGGSPTMVDQRETGRFVVSKTASDTWSITERFAHLGMGEPIAIPQTNSTVPENLW